MTSHNLMCVAIAEIQIKVKQQKECKVIRFGGLQLYLHCALEKTLSQHLHSIPLL